MDVTVVTQNILNPFYAKKYQQQPDPDGSGWNTSRFGKWKQDLDIIETATVNAKRIFCNQEVDEEIFTNQLNPEMRNRGYVGVFRKMDNYVTNGGKNGVALFYKTTEFERLGKVSILENKKIQHDVTDPTKMTEGGRGLTIDLKEKTTGKMIRVANVHISGGPARTRGKREVESIVDALNRKGPLVHPTPAPVPSSGSSPTSNVANKKEQNLLQKVWAAVKNFFAKLFPYFHKKEEMTNEQSTPAPTTNTPTNPTLAPSEEAKEPDAIVMVGDFNRDTKEVTGVISPKDSQYVHDGSTESTDIYRIDPTTGLSKKIDHIFHKGFQSCTVKTASGLSVNRDTSDHLPVIVQLKV